MLPREVVVSTRSYARFLPTIIVIADSEDKEAHHVCLRHLMNIRGPEGPRFKDGFLDMRCLQSAECFFGDSMYLHRCLQHTLTNAKTAAYTKDKLGRTRLKKVAMWKDIEELFHFTAWLPDWEEFTLVWRHYLERLHHDEERINSAAGDNAESLCGLF